MEYTSVKPLLYILLWFASHTGFPNIIDVLEFEIEMHP